MNRDILSKMQTHRHTYDVCLSFAGEDRAYVENVANALRGLGVGVFYDAYEEADLWGKDLYQHFADVFETQGLYCVVFVSASYARKLWTRHELKHAQARAFKENREYLLPARFDDTDLPGVLSTVAYIDLRHKTPDDVAQLICQKLRRSTSPQVESAHLTERAGLVHAPTNTGLGSSATNSRTARPRSFGRTFALSWPRHVALAMLWVLTVFGVTTRGGYHAMLFALLSPLWIGTLAQFVKNFVTRDLAIARVVGGVLGGVTSAAIAYVVDHSMTRLGLTIGIIFGSLVSGYAVDPRGRMSTSALLVAALLALAGVGFFEELPHMNALPGMAFLVAAFAALLALLVALLLQFVYRRDSG